MSTDLSKPSSGQSMKTNQMMIVGRLESVSKFDGKFDHVITMPAPDEFSKPSKVRVSAKERLGDVDTMVKVLAAYNGWPNNYRVTDKETGDKREVKDVNCAFHGIRPLIPRMIRPPAPRTSGRVSRSEATQELQVKVLA